MADFNENMDASAQGGMESGAGAGRGLGQVPPVAQEPVSAASGMPQGAPQGYGQPRAPRPQGYPQGMPQGQMPQGAPQGRPMNRQMPPRRPGYPQGQMPPQGYPQGMPPQGYPQGQGMPPRGAAGAAAYGRGQYGQPGQPGQGMPPQGYPQGAPRPGQNPYQAQYARGQYGQGAPRGPQGNPNNYNQRVAGARAAGMGAAGAYGANRGGRGVNVQLMDQNGGSRYGRNVSTNAGAYKKDFGGNGPKIIKYAIFAVLIIILGVLVTVGVKACQTFNSLHGDKDEADQLAGVLTEVEKSDPFYMLLLGTDAAKYRDELFGKDVHNVSDSIMIVRVDPGNKKITMISLLRDSWIKTDDWDDSIWNLVDPDMKGYITAEIKANSLYQYGGAPLAVAVLSKYLDIPISHYASINMDGFVRLIDVVGEIEVNIPIDLWDSELEMGFTAGLHSLDGYEALVLVRMRHAYEDVEREQGLPGDVYRAANQRMVITAVLKKVLSSDLGTIRKVIEQMANGTDFVLDKTLGVDELLSLAMTFKDINTATDIWSTRVPNHGGEWQDGDWAAWLTMVKRMDQGLCPVTEDVVDAATGTILQSAGTGTIDDLKDLDDTYKSEPDIAGDTAGAAA